VLFRSGGLVGSGYAPIVEWARQRPIHIDKNKAVSIALIINELVVNALKHQPQPGAEDAPVLVCIEGNEEKATVTIRNRCVATPDEFDFSRGAGVGTGLTLVKSLLPPEGANLNLRHEYGEMTATLTLFPPVIARLHSTNHRHTPDYCDYH
jgi:two-component sensor histidine kinase